MKSVATKKVPIFLADRTDGLGERLRCLTNAILCSRKFAGDYCFTWQLRQGRQKEHNSIEIPTDIFDIGFLNSHMIIFPDNMPSSDIIDLSDYDPATFEEGPAKYIRVPQFPIYRIIPSLRHSILNGEFRTSFREIIFSDSIVDQLEMLSHDQIDANTVAMHLRAGDIIDGIYSDSARFCNKAIPYQVAERTIQNLIAEGKKIVILGQDYNLLSYFKVKYDCMLSSSFYNNDGLSPASSALADMHIMSKCNAIYAGSSGFSMLASSLANEIHKGFVKVSSETINSLVQLVSSMPDSNLISNQQQIFSLRWIIGMGVSYIDTVLLLQICKKGLAMNPNDLFFLLIEVFCYLELGDCSSASSLKDSIVNSFSHASLVRLLSENAFGRRESAQHVLPRLKPFILSWAIE